MTGRSRANGEGSIYPHRNGFAAYAWVTTPAGKRTRKYVYGPDRETVHRRWIALQRDAQRRPVATASPTVGDFLGYWLREIIEPNRAPLTVATYESLVRLYLVPGIGGKRLDRLSVRDVQTWMNGLRTACQCCAQGKDARRPKGRQRCCAVGKCCRQVPSARTIRDLRTVLRSALSTAQREELIAKNAAALVTVPTGRTRKTQAWTSDEARAFLESARSNGDPLYALYVLVLVLGAAQGRGARACLGGRRPRRRRSGSPLTGPARPPRAASPSDQDRGVGRCASASRALRHRLAAPCRAAGSGSGGGRRSVAG